MKISRYAYFFKTSKGACLAYSSRTNSFLELSDDVMETLCQCQKGTAEVSLEESFAADDLQTLRQEGFVCEEIEDDEFVLKSQFITQSIQHDKTQLSLVLVPTLDCNFNCPYCFENGKRGGLMDEATIEKLIEFIKGNDILKELSITWYGGEPLLGISVIEKILDRINKEVSTKIAHHSIVTNGYLFNDRAIRLFKRYPLESIQITLDGSAERHNRLRALKANGGPTFNTILDNVERIVEELPDTQLHIRVNIDKDNVDDYFEISKLVSSRFSGKNIIAYPGIIRLENEEKTSIVEPAFGRWETAEFMFDLYDRGVMCGGVFPALHLNKVCCALCVGSFIIGPKGEIYKCWNDVSDQEKEVGNIASNSITNKPLFYRYHQGCAWYNDPECKQCFFLPICNGKCAWYNERNIYHHGEFNLCQCIQKAPGLLNKSLEHYYEHVCSGCKSHPEECGAKC